MQQLSDQVYKQLKLRRRNVAYGSYNLNLPNGITISENLVSLSGEGVSNNLINQIGNSIGSRVIVPEVNMSNQKFTPAGNKATHDSERKIFEYIVNNMEQQWEISIYLLNSYQGRGFSGNITVEPEMSPCDSCTTIMLEQLQRFSRI